MEKEIKIIGGVGNKWDNSFHQQDRVYDKRKTAGAINAMANNGLVVRKWRKGKG